MAQSRHQLLMRCKPVTLAVMLAVGSLVPVWSSAQMPTGAQVVVPGSATVNTTDPSRYVVTQTGSKAIINWDSFSIGSGNTVQFVQPGRDSVILNRVVGNDVSNIYGSLTSNGQVFLVNPNGIYFAPGAQLDVGGLVASTLGIRDSDFLAGRYTFSRADNAVRAEVINAGILKAREGGYVVLAGDYAANRGVVEARLGTVMLGSAQQMTLDIHGDSLVSYALNERNMTALAGVENTGQLYADGGRVVMTAMTARSLTSDAVNNSGLIQARTVEEKGGAVYLLADDAGVAMTSTSRIDVSGANLGGKVLVGGNYQGTGSEVQASRLTMAAGATINADATTQGNGGQVVLWSTGKTDFRGAINAQGGSQRGDGGSVEVSGKQLAYNGRVDVRAAQGKVGTLLLDPANITISNAANSDVTATSPFSDQTNNGGTSNLNIATLQTALGTANVTVTTTTAAGADPGNITIVDALSWSSTNTLTLLAANQILINATVTGANGTLILNAAAGGVSQSAAVQVSRLGLLGAGTFTLSHANNAVGTLAANVTGGLTFNTTGNLAVGAVGTATGISTGNNDISVTSGGTLAINQLVDAGTSTLTLQSAGNLTQTAGAKGIGLRLLGSGAATLDNSANDFATVAVNRTGDVTLRNDHDTVIGTVGATAGANTGTGRLTLRVNGDVSQTAAITSGGLEVVNSGANKTVTLTNASNSFSGLAMNVNGTVDLRNSASSFNVRTVGNTAGVTTANHDFTMQNTGTMTLGASTSEGGIINAGTGTVTLNSNSVTQYGNSAITADKLLINATGYIGLSGSANSVNTLAFVSTGTSAFDYINNKSLTIGTVGATSGITTANTDAKVQAYGNITVSNNINTGTGTTGLLANNGSSYYDVNTGTQTITAGALAVAGSTLSLDKDVNGINNATGKMVTKKISIYSRGNFAYTTADELTIGNYMGLNGLTSSGHVYLKTGTFAGYALANEYSDYVDNAGNTTAGLMLEGNITAQGNSVYLNSDSGIFQKTTATAPSTEVPSITANQLMVFGEGQFSLLSSKNAVAYYAADTKGSALFSNSRPLTIDTLGFNAFGVSKTITGVSTRSDLIAGSVAAGTDEYNPHNIVLGAADDPNGGVAAMTINQSVIADSKGSSTINLAVGASTTHPNALAKTYGSAVIQGELLVLGGGDNKGDFEVKTNVSSLTAAGGRSMYVDNSAQTGALNVLGLGTNQGGASATPVGNVYITTGGDMTLLGGQSQGKYLQLRSNKLTVSGDVKMADGASIFLMPYDLSRSLGVHNASDYMGLNVQTNYERDSLQKFSQAVAFYFGSTPTWFNNLSTTDPTTGVPAAAKVSHTGNIRIGADGDGGLKLGYRSLSAETSYYDSAIDSIWGGNIGDVFNLRLIGQKVSIKGFNVTGKQMHVFSNAYTMPSTASNYSVAKNTDVTFRPYTLQSAVWIGDIQSRGGVNNYSFSPEMLAKFPDGTNFIFSGSTDSPLLFQPGGDIILNYDSTVDLGARTLNFSHVVWVYDGGLVFNKNTNVSQWNRDHPKWKVGYVKAYYDGDAFTDGPAPSNLGHGQGGGLWAGCQSLASCAGTNPSGTTGNTTSTTTTTSNSGGGNTSTGTTTTNTTTPSPPPATASSSPTNPIVNNAANTGNSTNPSNSSGSGQGATSPSTNTGTNPNDGMSDGGPSGSSGSTTGGGGSQTSIGSGSGTGTGSGGATGGGNGANAGLGGVDGDGSGLGSGGSGGSGSGSGASGMSGGAGAGNGGQSGLSGSGQGAGGGSGSGTGNTSGADSGSNGSGAGGSGSGSGAGSAAGGGAGSGANTGSANDGGSGGGSGGTGAGNGSAGGTGGASGSGSGADGAGTGGSGSGSGAGAGAGSASGDGSGNTGSSGANSGVGQGAGGDSGNGSGAGGGATGADAGAAGSGNAGAGSGNGTGSSGGGMSGDGDGGSGTGGAGSGRGTGSAGDSGTGSGSASGASGGGSGNDGSGNAAAGSGNGSGSSGAGTSGDGDGGSGSGGAGSGRGTGSAGDSGNGSGSTSGASGGGSGNDGSGNATAGSGKGSGSSGAATSGEGSDNSGRSGNTGGDTGSDGGASNNTGSSGSGTSSQNTGGSSAGSGGAGSGAGGRAADLGEGMSGGDGAADGLGNSAGGARSNGGDSSGTSGGSGVSRGAGAQTSGDGGDSTSTDAAARGRSSDADSSRNTGGGQAGGSSGGDDSVSGRAGSSSSGESQSAGNSGVISGNTGGNIGTGGADSSAGSGRAADLGEGMSGGNGFGDAGSGLSGSGRNVGADGSGSSGGSGISRGAGAQTSGDAGSAASGTTSGAGGSGGAAADDNTGRGTTSGRATNQGATSSDANNAGSRSSGTSEAGADGVSGSGQAGSSSATRDGGSQNTGSGLAGQGGAASADEGSGASNSSRGGGTNTSGGATSGAGRAANAGADTSTGASDNDGGVAAEGGSGRSSSSGRASNQGAASSDQGGENTRADGVSDSASSNSGGSNRGGTSGSSTDDSTAASRGNRAGAVGASTSGESGAQTEGTSGGSSLSTDRSVDNTTSGRGQSAGQTSSERGAERSGRPAADNDDSTNGGSGRAQRTADDSGNGARRDGANKASDQSSESTSGRAGSKAGQDSSASADGAGKNDGQDPDAGSDSRSQGGSGRGGSAGGAGGRGVSGTQQDTLCIGQQASRRNQELPEQMGALATKPLVEVRNGGVNLDSDCSKQAIGGVPVNIGGSTGR